MPFCSGVGVSRTDSGGDTGRVASSVDVSEGHDGGEVAEGVVGAASSGDTSGVHCCFPLANVVGKLTLVSNLGSPPLSSGSRSRDKSGDVSRGDNTRNLPLANVVGKLTLVGNLGSLPLGSSRGARDKSGNVSRGAGKARLTSAKRYQRQRRNLAEHVETGGGRLAAAGEP